MDKRDEICELLGVVELDDEFLPQNVMRKINTNH